LCCDKPFCFTGPFNTARFIQSDSFLSLASDC
jgi:hypothetical protein